MKLLLFLYLVQFSYSEIADFKISGYKRDLFTYKEVCTKLGMKHILFANPVNPTTMDCMGTMVKIKDFCQKVVPHHNFLRGVINTKMNEVACERGKSAILKIACDKKDKVYCINAEEGCEKLQSYYAIKHVVSHATVNEKDVDDILNCYFISKEREETSLEMVSSGHLEPAVIDEDFFSQKQNENPSHKEL